MSRPHLDAVAVPSLPDGHLVRPFHGGSAEGTGVLVLSGSSGRVERERAAVLAATGVTALTYRWFGAGTGLPEAVWEYPLEAFLPALDVLGETCDRLVLVGSSKTAEAFLRLAPEDPRVDAVVAFAPTHVAWANVGPGPDGQLRPCRSSWTWQGAPVPFVPYDDDAATPGDPPRFAPMYEQSLRTCAGAAPAALLPVERFFGDVLLVAGGDDGVWPALASAQDVRARRDSVGLPTTLVTHPGAGHRVVLPGEQPAAGGMRMERGGTEAADRELGRLAWPHVVRVLGGEAPGA